MVVALYIQQCRVGNAVFHKGYNRPDVSGLLQHHVYTGDVGNMVKRLKAPFLRQLCDHDRMILESTFTFDAHVVASLIRHFIMIISAWWLQSSSKYSGKPKK